MCAPQTSLVGLGKSPYTILAADGAVMQRTNAAVMTLI